MTNVELDGTASPGIPPIIQVTVRDDGTRCVVTVSGSLLIATAWRVREFDVEPTDTPVVVDLGDLTELDAAGVAAVVALARRIAERGTVVEIWNPSAPEPARVAAMTGVFELVNQRSTLAA